MEKETLRVLLIKQKNELLERTRKIHTDLSQRSVSKNFSQQVTERVNDDVLAALDSEAKTELAEIEHALERIEKGTYGQCLQCTGPISDERLKILPHTQYCRDCAASKQ